MSRPFSRFVSAIVMFCIISIQGCYTYRLQAPGKHGVAADGEIIWSLAWGLVQEQPRINNCHDQALAEVVVRSNLAFDLLTVVTLGFASPKKVQWNCAPPQPGEGTVPTDTTRSN